MKYAVVALGGRQYYIQDGQHVIVDKLEGEIGNMIALDKVLLIVDGYKREIGHPYIDQTKIMARVVEQTLGKKIRVAKFKAKSRYRRVMGHRAQLTKLLIEKID